MEPLTPREMDVLTAIAHGWIRVAEISSQLGISPHTVAVHKSSIYRKLGIASSGEAVLVALKMGLNREFRHRPGRQSALSGGCSPDAAR